MLTEKEFLDFVYVGAPRSGSTWLAAVLGEHPELWIPSHKEIHFFNSRLVYPFEYKYARGVEYYRTNFESAPPEAKIGELSPFYYFDPHVAYRIYKSFPGVRIIALLRNPVDVVYSLYLLLRQRERRAKTFEEEIIQHPDLLDLGFYHRMLTPYYDWFPKERIFVRTYEDFFIDEKASCRELFEFLGVDSSYKPSVLDSRINASTEALPNIAAPIRGHIIKLLNIKPFIPVKELLHRMRVNRMHSHIAKATNKTTENPKNSNLSLTTRKKLLAEFEPDIRRLEKLLGKDLSIWLDTAKHATNVL